MNLLAADPASGFFNNPLKGGVIFSLVGRLHTTNPEFQGFFNKPLSGGLFLAPSDGGAGSEAYRSSP